MKDKFYTEEELAAIGFEIIEARKKGGRTVFTKYGPNHFKELNKKSQETRKANKLLRRTII